MVDHDVSLSECETKLLITIEKSKEDKFFSVAGLAHETGCTLDEVEKALSSLELNGYLILTRVLKSSPHNGPTNEKVIRLIRDVLDCTQKLERISAKRKQTKERTFQKIKNEYVQKLEVIVDNIEVMLEELQKESNEFDKRIEGIKDRIEETRIRADISDISAEEADRLMTSYKAELQNLESRRKSSLDVFREMQDILDAKKSHSEILMQIEELEARHTIGEIGKQEYNQNRMGLEAEKTKLEDQIKINELPTKNNVHETIEKLTKLKDDAIVSKETCNRIDSVFEKLIKSKASKS